MHSLCSRLFGLKVVTTLVAMQPVLFFALPPLRSAPPETAATAIGSDEALGAMLQRIDAYRPTSEAIAQIRVFGSSSMDALAHGWAGEFRKFHKKADIKIHGANAEEAFRQLVEAPSSIAMLTRPVREDELNDLKARGLIKPVAFTVAREALSVFVHSSNPVNSISGQQLRAVFTTDPQAPNPAWNLVGATGEWASQPISLVSRTERCGTQKYLREFVFHSATMRDCPSTHTSNADVLKAVGADPRSIAICGMRSEGKNVKTLQLVAGDRVVPSDDYAVLSGQYPLTRPLTLVVDMGQTGAEAIASQEFVRFSLCRRGQTEAVLVGFFPVDLPLLRASLVKLSDAPLR